MFKKILFSLLSFLMVYSLAAAVYHLFEPDYDENAGTDELIIESESLNDYIMNASEGTIHYIFFYDSRSNDCEYVRNTLLATVSNDTQLQLKKIFVIADTSSMEEKNIIPRLQELWGIRSIPAFAVITKNGETTDVLSKLEWDSTHMLSAAEIEQWLIDNGLFQPAETAEPVETPEP